MHLSSKKYFPIQIIVSFVVACLLVFLCTAQVQAQQQHRRHRHRGHHQDQAKPIFSFPPFSHTPGFPGTDISSDLAAQLRSIPSSSADDGVGVPEYQEQPQRGSAVSATANGNELGGNGGVLPLYKQSYPGLYVKGHTQANFKYEPTRQVEHHHGPNYQAPRGIHSAAQHAQEYEQNPYSF